MDRYELRNRFKYHRPDISRANEHNNMRGLMQQVAEYMNDNLPEGREKAHAITKLEEAMFWSNAAIARQDG